MRKEAKVGIGVALAAVVAFGAYQWNEARVCSNLEEDLLNGMSDFRGNNALRQVPDRTGTLRKSADLMDAQAQAKMQTAASGLAQRCGQRALDSAMRRVRESIND
jgi:hypothetical protein